jgi:polyhydroxyalkanoate synthase
MVTKAAVETLMDHVSSSDKEFAVVAGGHMGILSGSKAPVMFGQKSPIGWRLALIK